MKKNILWSAMVALFVSMVCMGGFYLIGNPNNTVRIQHVSNQPAVNTLYSKDADGNLIPVDFHETAMKVIDGVVHIQSTHLYDGRSQSFERQRFFNPFEEFFGKEWNPFQNPPIPRDRNSKVPSRVGSGSGVIISEDGYIVTNNHVIAEADDIEVTLHDNRTYKAKVVGSDPSTDLALLQIKAKALPTVPLVNSDDVHIGQWVLAVGNPMGLNSTVTAGIVSATGRNININRDKYAVENFIQTDAAINPGNSGGALVNLNGGLIGINTAIASPTGSFAGYGFAVPANIVEKVIKDILEFGSVQRGVLGIMIRTLDSNLAKEKDLDISQGVYVDSLLANSAAKNAGIQVGDIITSVNQSEVRTSPELQGIIAQHRPGESVLISVNRNGKTLDFNVTLNNREGSTDLVSRDNREIIKILGADLETLDKSTARKLDIKGGVKITRLYPGKLSKYTEMKAGFIITKIDGRSVKDVDELVDILESKEGGVMLEGIYEEIPGTYYYAFGMTQ